jgi:hypothetical protein
MAVERIRMPKADSGRRVADRFLCERGHLHPSHRAAVKCNQKREVR